MGETKGTIHTHPNDNFILSLEHCLLLGSSTVELGEGWKTGSTHPVLEVFICLEIWNVVVGVTVWITIHPIRWGDDFINGLIAFATNGSLGVLLLFTWPSDILVREIIRLGDTFNLIQEFRVGKGVCGEPLSRMVNMGTQRAYR